jgi:hypothetical protein
MAASTRFGAQERKSGAISPKMVEQQLEGNMSSQPCGKGPAVDLVSSFNFSSFSSLLVFFSNGGYSDSRPTRARKEGYHPLSPHMQCPK